MGCCCQGLQLEDPVPFAGIPGNLCVPLTATGVSLAPLGERQEESRVVHVVLEQDRPCWWHFSPEKSPQ